MLPFLASHFRISLGHDKALAYAEKHRSPSVPIPSLFWSSIQHNAERIVTHLVYIEAFEAAQRLMKERNISVSARWCIFDIPLVGLARDDLSAFERVIAFLHPTFAATHHDVLLALARMRLLLFNRPRLLAYLIARSREQPLPGSVRFSESHPMGSDASVEAVELFVSHASAPYSRSLVQRCLVYGKYANYRFPRDEVTQGRYCY